MRQLVISIWMTFSLQAATLDVTDYGAVGDCAEITVSVLTNSPTITAGSSFSGGDVGKVVQIFGAGYYAILKGPGEGGYFNGNYSGTPTNHTDLVAQIVSVDGVNATLDRNCGVSASDLRCTIGTQNKTAFDTAIAAAAINDTIYIPAGNYHLVAPSALDTNYTQTIYYSALPTITINARGGLRFLGDGTNSTILTGSGAWQQKGYDDAYRGYLFRVDGNVTAPNDGPLVFDGIQFDGNATRNHSTLYTFWPAVPTDGSGWDGTHHAVVFANTPEGPASSSFTNCLFTRWHGETLAGIAGGTGTRDIGNCWFVDGNSTVINFNLRHDFHDNFVTDYFQCAEDGQFIAGTGLSYIRNNVISNIYGSTSIALVGASTNWSSPGYVISSNTFYIAGGKYAIATAGISNLTIFGNTINTGMVGFGIAGNQGTYWNSDILVSSNTFNNQQVALMFLGSGANRIANVTVEHNTGTSLSSYFAMAASGAGSWTTNALFRYNTANKSLSSTDAYGQWFKDDGSNDFPWKSNTDAAGTNIVSYAYGSKHQLTGTAGTVWALASTATAQIPPTAVVWLTNTTASAVSVHLNSAANDSPVSLANGVVMPFYWYFNAWHTNSIVPSSVSNLRVSTIRGK